MVNKVGRQTMADKVNHTCVQSNLLSEHLKKADNKKKDPDNHTKQGTQLRHKEQIK